MTLNVIVPLPVPEVVFRLSQGAVSEAVQFRVPAPVLEMVRFCARGLLPPCRPAKEKLVALSPIVGLGAVVTENVTAID